MEQVNWWVLVAQLLALAATAGAVHLLGLAMSMTAKTLNALMIAVHLLCQLQEKAGKHGEAK